MARIFKIKGDKLDKFNSKGMSIYGPSWDTGEIPIRDLVTQIN